MEPVQSPPGYPPITPQTDVSGGNKKKFVIIAGVVGLLFLLVTAVLLLLMPQGNKSGKTTAEVSPTPGEPLVLSEVPYGILYGTANTDGVFIKIYDFVGQKETILSTLPTNIKKVSVLSPTQILYINKTNEYDNGEELVIYDIKQKEPISVIKADNGFVIDEYVFSPNKDFIAIWEISPNSSGTLIGGRSRVNTIALAEPQVKNRIYDETATYDSPIHYPSAITDDGAVFMDRFLPNSGAGWAYGTTLSSFDATQKEELEAMKSGTYGTKLSVSPKGDLIAFGGYDGSKGDGLAITEGFRTAVVYVNTIEMLDLQTKRRWKLSNLPKDSLFNSINWSYDGTELYFVAITKSPETTGSYVYSLTDQKARKLQADRKAAIATALPGNKVLVGTLDDSLGNLGYTYAAPFRSLSVVDNLTGQQATIPIQDGKVQFISAVDHTTFPDVLGESTSRETLLAQEGRKNLQLEVFYPSFTPTPTQFEENRRRQQTEPLSPTPTRTPTRTPSSTSPTPTRTPTRTPTPTQRQTIGINPGGSTSTPTPTPQGGIVSCQDIARAQCTAQYPDNIDLRGQCIEDLKPILLQNGQCNSSPLYLYGNAGQRVSIVVHTPVYNTDPISKGVYTAVINNNASLTVNNTNVASISFDYVPALRMFEKPKRGSIVRKQDVGLVLSEYAKKLGLNEKETIDLVAYGKKSVTKPYVFISFFDEQTSKLLLPIAFTPQPDTYLNYVFYFKQFNDRPTFSTLPVVFPSVQERIGFTAVEISGMVE
jgi:hypothetical protein